jgi:lincosamide nucleotidyltransferase A/C/D/E
MIGGVNARDAAALYALLTTRGMRCWVVGGWGVDALLGRQTRPHEDLDVLTLLSDLPTLTEVLAEHGFVRTLVWEENRWLGDQATAFVAEDSSGRQLDVHVMETPTVPAWNADWPYELDALDGHRVIAGTPVDCATAAVQIVWHGEYELPPAHAQDLRLLQDLHQNTDQLPCAGA